MKYKYTILFFSFMFFFFCEDVFSQKEMNHWYFGYNAGLDFSSGSPVAVTNGQVNTNEGCASISDTSGNLLFYSDGMKVWNRNHVQMPNGFGLTGMFSSTQSSLIFQKPGNDSVYCLFTVGTSSSKNWYGLRYNEVDLRLNGGLGDVTIKNVLLDDIANEQLTAIKHCNNKDFWVVTHDTDFCSYLVSSSGISAPVISKSNISFGTIGYIKASPNGKKFVYASYYAFLFDYELFDFDNSSGKLTNAISLFNTSSQSAYYSQWANYGAEFSPDGTKVYFSNYQYGTIYQFNICAGSDSAIVNSKVLITGLASTPLGALQLGPDNKIYVANYNATSLGVINNPNNAGVGCNYQAFAVSLSGKKCGLGLPNFIHFEHKAPLQFSVSVICTTASFVAPTQTVNSCAGPISDFNSVKWDFGDPLSSVNTSTSNNAIHNFSGPGTYTVSLVLFYNCYTDTIKQKVIISQNIFSTTISGTNTICKGQNTTLTVNGWGNFIWNTGDSIQTIVVSPTVNTTYSATIISGVGCIYNAVQTITVHPNPVATISGDTSICRGAKITLNGSGGATYLWNTGANTSSISAAPLSTSVYSLQVKNNWNCSATATRTVIVYDPPIAKISGKDSVCYSNENILTAYGGSKYLWNTGETNSILSVYSFTNTTYSVIVYNAHCSDTASRYVKVIELPEVYATASKDDGLSAHLFASGGGSYEWSPAYYLSCTTCSDPIAEPDETTIYHVKVTGHNQCSKTASVKVTISSSFIPNTFTPNNDNLNDVFMPLTREIHDYQLLIYNRWGQKIFESNMPQIGWDGNYNNNVCEEGVYVYKLQFTNNSDGKYYQYDGNVTLMR